MRIEKKYLIREDGKCYPTEALLQIYASVDCLKNDVLNSGRKIKHGYLPIEKGIEIADKLKLPIRFKPTEAGLRDNEGKLFLTSKGDGDLSELKLEERVNKEIFDEAWPLTEGKRIEKVKLVIPYDIYKAEIDVYTDRDLILAKIEVPTEEEAQKLVPLGFDVTADRKYKNKNLAK